VLDIGIPAAKKAIIGIAAMQRDSECKGLTYWGIDAAKAPVVG